MTLRDLESFLMRIGVYRADIVVRHGEIDIIVSKKNSFILEKFIKPVMPVGVYCRIIVGDKNWIKNRKKCTYGLKEDFTLCG